MIAAGLCIAVSVVLGLLPALRLSRPNLIPALKDDAGAGGLRASRIHRAAASIQVAIAVPFLVISGVMLDRVRTADFGFDTEGLVAARFDPGAAARRGGAALSLRSVRATLAEASGVVSVTMADGMPIDFVSRYVRVSQANGTEFVSAHVTRVAEGYLEALGVRLLRGRGITADDRAADARVVVISEPLAARLFPDGDAIGKRLTLPLEEHREEEFTIIGVTADFATSQLTTERPQMLLPLSEKPGSAVLLIARAAPADETRLASAFQNVGSDLGLDFLPDRSGIFGEIVTGSELVRKSDSDLVAEIDRLCGPRRDRTGVGVAWRARGDRVHGRDADPRDCRADGAGGHPAARRRAVDGGCREARRARRGRRTGRRGGSDSNRDDHHGYAAGGRVGVTRCGGTSDLRRRRFACPVRRARGWFASRAPRGINRTDDCDALGITASY